MWQLVGTPASTVNWIAEGDSRVRNSVLGLWSLRSGDRVAKPGRLVVFLSCGGEGCECQSQPTGAPRDSGTSSPRRGHPFGTADASHLHSHLGIPGMSPMLRSPEPSPVGSQCLPKAGSGSASALDGHLAGWVPAPLGQFLPQLISSLWPMPGSEPSLAEHAACVVSARQACFCCWHWPHFPGTLPGGHHPSQSSPGSLQAASLASTAPSHFPGSPRLRSSGVCRVFCCFQSTFTLYLIRCSEAPQRASGAPEMRGPGVGRIPEGLTLSLPMGLGTGLCVGTHPHPQGLNGAGVGQYSRGWSRAFFFYGRHQRAQETLEPAVAPCLPDLKPTGNVCHKSSGFGVSLERQREGVGRLWLLHSQAAWETLGLE